MNAANAHLEELQLCMTAVYPTTVCLGQSVGPTTATLKTRSCIHTRRNPPTKTKQRWCLGFVVYIFFYFLLAATQSSLWAGMQIRFSRRGHIFVVFALFVICSSSYCFFFYIFYLFDMDVVIELLFLLLVGWLFDRK